MIFMILLNTAIFEKRQYLVAAFAVSLACAVLRYRLLKVSSVNYLPSRSYRTAIARPFVARYSSCMLVSRARPDFWSKVWRLSTGFRVHRNAIIAQYHVL